MSDKKKAEMDDAFHDLNGNSVSLFKLVRSEPEWAAARIREGKRIQADNERLRELLKDCKPYIAGWLEARELFSEIQKEVGDE